MLPLQDMQLQLNKLKNYANKDLQKLSISDQEKLIDIVMDIRHLRQFHPICEQNYQAFVNPDSAKSKKANKKTAEPLDYSIYQQVLSQVDETQYKIVPVAKQQDRVPVVKPSKVQTREENIKQILDYVQQFHDQVFVQLKDTKRFIDWRNNSKEDESHDLKRYEKQLVANLQRLLKVRDMLNNIYGINSDNDLYSKAQQSLIAQAEMMAKFTNSADLKSSRVTYSPEPRTSTGSSTSSTNSSTSSKRSKNP